MSHRTPFRKVSLPPVSPLLPKGRMATSSLNSGDTNCDQGGVGLGGTAPRRAQPRRGTQRASAGSRDGGGGDVAPRRSPGHGRAPPCARQRAARARLLDDVRSVLPMPSTGRGRGPGRRSRSSRRTPPGDPLPLQVRKCARVAAAAAAARLRAAAGLRAASGRAHQGGENIWLLLQQMFIGDPRRRCAERWPRDTAG